ncbi:MAG TPA: glycerate kinase [Actinomycetota bacterium]|nr:glycerate kinase [Actinomycetota bacterium]
MRVLVAPDKFKGTLTAPAAASAIARGWSAAEPAAQIEQVPLADGGEGTLDALLAARGGERRTASVTGPLGERVEAEFGLIPVPGGPLGVVEMARASGLQLVPPDHRDPKVTTSRGTGELVLAALESGARRILVCVGGSATNDGGAGLAQALGVRLRDAGDREVAPGGAALASLDRVDLSVVAPAVRGVPVDVAVDVDNPMVGPSGASAVYAPQKGASPADAELLDGALRRFAEVVRRETGVDIATRSGMGAAGGLPASLVAFFGATLRSGLELVMQAAGLPERMRGAAVAVTGEGTFDAQSLRGKVVGGVVAAARAAGVPRVMVLCGAAAAPPPEGVTLLSLAERFGAEGAIRRAEPLLERLAAEAGGWPRGSP